MAMFKLFSLAPLNASDHEGAAKAQGLSGEDTTYPGLQAHISDDELIREALREYAETGGPDFQMGEPDSHGDLYDTFVDELSAEMILYGDVA